MELMINDIRVIEDIDLRFQFIYTPWIILMNDEIIFGWLITIFKKYFSGNLVRCDTNGVTNFRILNNSIIICTMQSYILLYNLFKDDYRLNGIWVFNNCGLFKFNSIFFNVIHALIKCFFFIILIRSVCSFCLLTF